MQYSRRQNVNVRSHSALTLTSLKEPAKCSQTRSFVSITALPFVTAYAQLLKSYSTTQFLVVNDFPFIHTIERQLYRLCLRLRGNSKASKVMAVAFITSLPRSAPEA